MNHPPLTGSKLVWITLALSMSVFMQVLDTTIANVALPTISGNLGAATSQGTWVITSFGVANAIAVPLTGWLAKRLGEVKLFTASTLLFVLTSWLCGMSSSLEMLIFFRVLQGAVAGPMIPLSQSLLLSCYPPEKKGMALALWAMTVIVAPVFGPILGGVISDNWHWGWIFFINVPVGLAAAFISWRILKPRETETVDLPIDRIGLALLVIGVGALQMVLDRGKELDWFNSTEVITLAVIAVLALVYLVIWELGEKHPIVDLSLFKQRNFTVGTIAISLGFMLYFGTVVLLPLMLQTQMGYTATWAGLAAAPIGLIPVVLSPIIGKYAQRLDMRWVVTVSFSVYAVCFFWRSTFNPQMDFAYVVWPQVVQGIGVACFFMPLTTITLSGLHPSQIASASSLSNFLRILAGSIGTSITTTMWDRREAMHHARLTEHVSLYDQASNAWFRLLDMAGLSSGQQAALTSLQITKQGYIMAANEIFWLSGVLFVLLIGLVWFAKPPFTASGGDSGAH
ncbi:DHA2 family efflux MFS transporter permease subunit [Chromobacterium haemolyticum]|uniref:DHA2 family efflux MFS transporter permease subunit n=1 Tax=Chromobacterium haemolyticum TaxID=394935 RepID=A0ABS3GJ07_9NEIS|nr:DHA2 family efflux MFS transporter permease subunit [Chromobacterium haemolyticum]MBK0415542.1 DHA2 family efflux MFS transporter permease subunit [Chromobacterium haemolyticum]MBO0415038.1 DHA2 family efflux MFS transporter permease subunit [Chromobacterium haemolyticum]MBO0498299.1 DHA2 family efflux MFS transporter permease subunit [Chromobacterium haemolyticum]